MPSTLASKAAGTFVADGPPPSIALLAWVQEACRSGDLHPGLAKAVQSLPGRPNPKLARVENVDADFVYGFVPYRDSDHESASTFLTEVRFRIGLKDRSVQLVS